MRNRTRSIRYGRAIGVLVLAGCCALTGCTAGAAGHPEPTGPPNPAPGRTSAAATGSAEARPHSSTEPEASKVTKTDEPLPPPPAPTEPAPKSAGPLTARDLPVPAGWRTVARAGGAEEGYQGNGTWVYGRDPRYAAFDTISVGCAAIARDDYTDPTAALEGNYGKRGAVDARPGVGLVMQFRSAADARSYFGTYVGQVKACDDPGRQTYARVLAAGSGLIDRRTYDGTTDWTEVAAVHADRATFVILTDPGHRISRSRADALLARLRR